MVSVVKNPPANAGDTRDSGSIPGSERSPGVGNGKPLQYSCLENPMDRGAWQLQSVSRQESDITECARMHARTYTHTHTHTQHRENACVHTHTHTYTQHRENASVTVCCCANAPCFLLFPYCNLKPCSVRQRGLRRVLASVMSVSSLLFAG